MHEPPPTYQGHDVINILHMYQICTMCNPLALSNEAFPLIIYEIHTFKYCIWVQTTHNESMCLLCISNHCHSPKIHVFIKK
jgi:hypothetical protein